ncbi:MAG TPA: cysteine desulfurase [Gemmatimonadales bacterium]|nr:cysteine desulfurase [Gemmatimonadales bacterium]
MLKGLGLLEQPASSGSPVRGPFPVEAVRRDFPILGITVRGRPLVYLDNAATSQKPQAVIDAIGRFYATGNANIHRGVYALSEQATVAYDQARSRVARFLGAASPSEIVFTRGTTEAINLVAQSWGRAHLGAGDEILVTAMEHHSNLIPWQLIAEQTGAVLRAAPINQQGELDLEAWHRLLSDRTRLVAVTHVSNALGTLNPIRELADAAHARGAVVVVDGAQSAPHLPIDVVALGCDFFACSGHKLYGPTGIGVLYGRAELLQRMPPWQGGGGMIASVTLERSTWAEAPARFEAGTPPIAEAIGLAAALDYIDGIGFEAISVWEDALLRRAVELVGAVPSVRLIGTAAHRAAVLSFLVEGIHPHDVGAVLDDEGIAVRAGHHCAQPVMRHFGIPATLRASFAFYNTMEEVETLARGLGRVREVFG